MQFKVIASAAAAALISALPAHASTTIFNALLTGAAEAPPNGSGGAGFAIVTLDDAAFTMRVQSVFAGLTGSVTVTHIHCCTAAPGTGTAGVATTTPTFPGFPVGVSTGTYDATFDMLSASSWNAAYITNNGGTVNSAFAALQTGLNNGSAYFNVHSDAFPGGEIRGFLVTQVPEPSTYALMALGLAVVGGLARRQRTA